jgi:SET domain-containing protein
MLMVSTYLAPSAIEGLGVFAGEFIQRGQLLWRLNAKFDIFVRRDEIDGLPDHVQDFIARYGYPHLEMQEVVIVDSDNGRFMNHSLAPNTDFRIFDRGYALVDIARGDEITCNYHEFDPTFAGFFAGHAAAARHEASLRSNGR